MNMNYSNFYIQTPGGVLKHLAVMSPDSLSERINDFRAGMFVDIPIAVDVPTKDLVIKDDGTAVRTMVETSVYVRPELVIAIEGVPPLHEIVLVEAESNE